MPEVALNELVVGSVVRTPEVLISKGITADSVVVYGGWRMGTPFFMSKGSTQPLWWPIVKPPAYVADGLMKYEPVPELFDVVGRDNDLTAQNGRIYASGCDPEIFVTREGGRLIPARQVLKSKAAGSGMFYDGLQAEFTPSAGGCLEGLGNSIQHRLASLLSAFRAKHSKARLSITNTWQLTQKEMDALDDEDVVFRCSDSMNVYGDLKVSPEPRSYLYRFAGGHIHVGSSEGYPKLPKPAAIIKSMVRAMDAIVGVPAVSMARDVDTPERRKNYGPAGEFRLPAHGLEYRVLSNFWLRSPLIFHLTFELARWGYRLGESGVFDCVWQGSDDETRACINNCDVKLAEQIIKRNAGVYQELFKQKWDSAPAACAMETILHGSDVVLKDPADIEGNWCLTNGQWISYGDGPNQKWRRLVL